MVAKRSSRALALLLALPTAALALGMGDIRLLSPLNAPLDAEVDLVDVAPDEANTVQAQLASRETFARYGLDWPAYLAGVQVRTVRAPDGRQMLKLRSTDAISEPFITLLVEVNWARGHLVREYTMLLDPPVYTPGQSGVAGSPVSAPATGSGAREGAIARAGDPAPAATAATGPESSAASGAPPARASAAGGDPGGGSMHVVQRGETLSAIASSEAGAGANTPRTRSLMVAIYQANPRAFEKNMNVLHSGALLRIPDAAQAAAVSPSEAAAEIGRQYAAWRSSSGAAAAPSGERPGRLKLVTPSESPSVGATPGAAPGAEVGQLQGRVHDLEGQLAESKRLLDLKNADLAHLQEQLAAKQAPPAPPAPPPTREAAPPAPAPAPAAQAPVEQAPAPQAAPPPPIEEKPPQTAAEAPPPPSAEPAPTPVPPPAGGSLVDTLLGYWWAIGLLLLVLVAFAGSRIIRARRAAQFDDSLGRLTGSSDTGFAPGRGFGSAEPMQAAASPQPAFLVEETGTHERPRFPAGGAQAAPAARHAASDDTISSETAINLDQGDPLAEADFHMAYGLYDQAADLIRIAVSREPARRDLRLKLLEVFFVWGNKDQFLTAARELADSREEAAPGEWEKILIMGKQLAPEDSLFSGAGAVSGATAGGVDLDLEGGQSRVDFDLMGEPIAGDATQRVDLDIGAAVDERTTESPTNVTDSNALVENTFLSTTGTTRQMTARMRHDGGLGLGSTAEMEGPTVEQPTIATTQENPTIRQKLESALKQSGDQTAELAIDDLGLDVGQVDTVDQPGLAGVSGADAPTLVAGFDERSRQVMEDAQHRREESGAWQFDHDELEAALTQNSQVVPDTSATSRLAALGAQQVDVDLGDSTGTQPAVHTGGVDLDVGGSTGTHAANGGGLDLDVGTATVPDTAFAATQRLSSEDLALPDLEPVTMSEVGTKLDLARAYMDMGDPDGARNILEEVLAEGSAAQKQEAQRLMESLPG